MSSHDTHPPQSDIASPGIKDEAPSATLESPQGSQQQSHTSAVSSSEPVQNAAVPAPQTENTQKNDNAESTQAAGVYDSSTPIITAQQSISDASPTNDKPPDTAGLDTADTPVPEPLPGASDAAAKEVEDSGPSLNITLLLTTGSRHPFEIDGKYLRKRGINVEGNDPFAMSVYTLKELIWKDWRQDWESQPTSPSSIRLISFGKLLDDKSPLSDCKFNKDAPNVVHMTVKPQEIVDEEDAKAAKAPYSRERESSERSPGCRCIIQ
ncbi:hypothetical protein Asppvi_004887 [Aspergillus pseudoviridinutans]|uniref:UBL3-like ubiquitin domain-containing protein n=1 Tax=Aspergillus pseudoviridinutans TaxID=1517512 RepID=A0A9P3B9U7_9EURO|nr:uncharacterized protein Asppvi_004887 [Aspergillus pseudoviridinutans]GIJ86014.1 hypothetical protein Asppvi_004887 [Aspergillus pseudoviridinutans]